MKRRMESASVVLPCALLVALSTSTCGTAIIPGAADEERSMVVEPAVVEALRAQGRVDVVIALSAEGSAAGDVVDDAAPNAIARWQDEVLSDLAPADFQLRHRYGSVPALAGTVLSDRGLAALRAHPRVARVGLDPGGSGGGRRAGSGAGRGATGGGRGDAGGIDDGGAPNPDWRENA